MTSGIWDKVKDMFNENRRPPTHTHTVVKRHVFSKTFETIPHAILGCDGKVLAIRSYPRTTNSNAVIPITEDTGPCAVGYVWDGTTFNRPEFSNYV